MRASQNEDERLAGEQIHDELLLHEISLVGIVFRMSSIFEERKRSLASEGATHDASTRLAHLNEAVKAAVSLRKGDNAPPETNSKNTAQKRFDRSDVAVIEKFAAGNGEENGKLRLALEKLSAFDTMFHTFPGSAKDQEE